MASETAHLLAKHLRTLSAAARADSLPDRELIQRFAAQRDEDVFAALVRRHGPMVLRVCQRILHNAHDAEDVFQATFLVLSRKAASLRRAESLACWLHGIAHRLALKARTQLARQRMHESRAAVEKYADDPLAELSVRKAQAILDEELARLPEKYRAPLLLCCLEGRTRDEAARLLGWSTSVVKSRLEQGRERLRSRLLHRGLTLPAALIATLLAEGATPAAVAALLIRTVVQTVTTSPANGIAPSVALLAESALRGTATVKAKVIVGLLLLTGAFAAGMGTLVPQQSAVQPSKIKGDTPEQPRPVENKHVHKDRFGDPLPEGAKARLGTVRLRHQGVIAAAVFTPDGKTVIVGDTAGDIISWDVASGRKIRRYNRTSPSVGDPLALSADGKTLVSPIWGGGVCFWDVETGKQLSHHPIQGRITQLLLTPDNKTLIVGDDNSKTIQLWDIAGKKKRHELKDQKGRQACIALSPDGKTLASESAKDRSIHLWDVATGKEKLCFAPYKFGLRSVTFSPDGKTLVTTECDGYKSGGLRFWDAATGKRLREQRTVHAPLNFAYSPDGKILAGCEDDRRLHVYDAASGKHLCAHEQILNNGCGPIFSPDSKTIATYCSPAQAVYLHDAASGKPRHSAPAHRSCINGLVFADDGKTLFSTAWSSPSDELRVWDASTGEASGQLDDNHPIAVVGLALSPDGKLLAACRNKDDNTTRLWDPIGRKEVCALKGYTALVDSIVWSADGKMLASSSYQDRTIRLWDAASGKPRRTIEAKLKIGGDIALSPDGKIVAVGIYRSSMIHLWSTETGKELPSITTPQDMGCASLSAQTVRSWPPADWKGAFISGTRPAGDCDSAGRTNGVL